VRAVVEDEERPPLPADCPTHLRQLIESCWDAYPENRPDFDEINSVLDEIIVEAAISELSACRFWMRYFIKEVTSTHQHTNTSTHQHTNTSTHQHTNTSTHQHINTPHQQQAR
jgi:hypothetical protein